MLKLDNLSVKVWDKQILKSVDFEFELWKNYAILGKNWSWKSSLLFTIMGHPNYVVNWWDISLDWNSILDISPDEKAKNWIYLAFQNVPEIPWIKLFEFLKTVYNSFQEEWKKLSFMKFKKVIEPIIDELWISKDFLFRDLNVWFSWWEKRKVELIQIKMLKPKYIMLDEIDSWLDVNSLNLLWEIVKETAWNDVSFIIISHYFEIYNFISLDKVLVMNDWSISKVWDKELINEIKNKWF